MTSDAGQNRPIAQMFLQIQNVETGLQQAGTTAACVFNIINPVTPLKESYFEGYSGPADLLDFLGLFANLYQFCIPPNPLIKALRLQAELNLHKLRTCRNIAGMEREVEPYVAPTDAESGLPMIGANGTLTMPGPITLPPTIFRYSVLIERAKQLVQEANQFESAMLSAIEKRDSESYNVLKARQDLRLSRQSLRLQQRRVKESEDGVGLAELQRERGQIQVDHFERLLDEGTSALERESIALLEVAAGFQAEASVLNLAAAIVPSSVGPTGVSYSPSGQVSSMAAMFSNIAGALGTTSSVLSTLASYERREQDWEFSASLAQHDVLIGAQQIILAQDRVRISIQERLISETQVGFAEETLNFLSNKFTNVELYEWMSNVLEAVYGFFLQQATATAQLAERQLAFERQETPPPMIQDDYWEAPSELAGDPASEEDQPDRRGLTGSARLTKDIFQLDQYAFETDQRKLHLTKTLPLAQSDPYMFQLFRQTGVLPFHTSMELFDRDFPGHYLRLIKQIRVSVLALVPPNQGIRATLRNVGNSKVVAGGPMYPTLTIQRGPESVALTSSVNATGVFELEPHAGKLRPFEGSGVDSAWQLEMPKASNLFDFRTIADVLITIDYSALESFDHRHRVIQELDPMMSADRAFSFRNSLADAWYDLNNPDLTTQSTPGRIGVSFTIRREDFPPNLDDLTIAHVALYFVRPGDQSFEFQDVGLTMTPTDGMNSVGGTGATVEGLSTTRNGSGGSLSTLIGRSPGGSWELSIPDNPTNRGRFKDGHVSDIVLILSYLGRTQAWPA